MLISQRDTMDDWNLNNLTKRLIMRVEDATEKDIASEAMLS